MNQSETVFTKVLLFPGNVNCRYYDKPSYNIEVTLESNLQTAIKSIRQARRDRAAGVPNQEYLKWCKKNLAKAIKLCRETERKSCLAS